MGDRRVVVDTQDDGVWTVEGGHASKHDSHEDAFRDIFEAPKKGCWPLIAIIIPGCMFSGIIAASLIKLVS